MFAIKVTRMIREIEASYDDALGAVFNLDRDIYTLGVTVMQSGSRLKCIIQ